MIAPEIISDITTALQIDESGEHALIQMHEHNMSQLPVLDGNKYIGLVTMEDVINMKHLSKPLKNFGDKFRKPFVLHTAHIFDVMKAALDFNVRVVPVVDEQKQYLGLVSAESCLRAFATLNSVKSPGAIIEMQIAQPEFSLTEIARLAAENDVAILAFYSGLDAQTGIMNITLKLNTTDVASLMATFERFSYDIKEVHNEVAYSEDLKDRYDALMRYLNV
ncbi:MAG: CBS domain-containing protein [Bacteroidetes bacterium]|nr:CBS domain-containing protein [Bacteroidota bacterium]MBK8657978.1 CBS domain-containing protein [Bacteroidota bacterium]